MGSDRDLAAWTELARRELVDLVGITSFSDEEHQAIDHVVERCAELGLPVRRQPVSGAGDNLLVGWSEEPELLLTAHLDTIRPTWDWSGEAEVRGDLIYGLGAQDDKGCVVAGLLAMVMAREDGVPVESLPIGVGLCVDEEHGGKGSLAMAELRPRLVVGLEGTELSVGLAEVGFVEAWIHVKGVAVHGALRELGDNAIEKALALVAEIQDHPGSAHVHPLLGRNIPLVWEIRGGHPLNVVPDRCSVHIDWRVTPGGPTAAELLDWLEGAADRAGGVVELIEIVEPFEVRPDAEIAQALSAALLRTTGSAPPATGMTAWTDAHNFVDFAGSQAVVFGPGHLRNAHRPDEFVSLTEVVTCARALAALIADAPSLFGGQR